MSDEGLPRRLRMADGVVFRELDGEAVILHLDSGTYFGLDGIGTRVWRSLEAHAPLDAVVEAVVDEYDVDRARARADITRLVGELVSRGLMVAGDGERAD